MSDPKHFPLRIVFAGTPEFAVPALEQLIHSPHAICGVFTQPDRPAGRGMKLQVSPVKKLALQHEIPVLQPESWQKNLSHFALSDLQSLAPDVMIVAAYGCILPEEALMLPRYGSINIHASLLPRWRGAAPIQAAILAGDVATGITIMQMTKGLDSGPILKQANLAIQPNDTAGTLLPQLAHLGGKVLLETLENLPYYQHHALSQDKEQVTYFHKFTKQQAQLDWQLSAVPLARYVRAFAPKPGAWSILNGEIIKITTALPQLNNATESPGTIVSVSQQGILVATQEGCLNIQQYQRSGGKIITVATDSLHSLNFLKVGMRFDQKL